MAVKDVISRGIGPSTSLAFFVTGGFAIGEAVAVAPPPDICVLAQSETVAVLSESDVLLVAAESETIEVLFDSFTREEDGSLLAQSGIRILHQGGGEIIIDRDTVIYDVLVPADRKCN
ncbi:MAG: hypothetical protein V3U60_11180 [Gammaproteobacteria bacterium]